MYWLYSNNAMYKCTLGYSEKIKMKKSCWDSFFLLYYIIINYFYFGHFLIWTCFASQNWTSIFRQLGWFPLGGAKLPNMITSVFFIVEPKVSQLWNAHERSFSKLFNFLFYNKYYGSYDVWKTWAFLPLWSGIILVDGTLYKGHIRHFFNVFHDMIGDIHYIMIYMITWYPLFSAEDILNHKL